MPLTLPKGMKLHSLLIGDQKAHSTIDVKFIKRIATPITDTAAFQRQRATRDKAAFPAASHLHTLRDLKARKSERDAKIEALRRDLRLTGVVDATSKAAETDTASSRSSSARSDEPSHENAAPPAPAATRTMYVRRRHSSDSAYYAPASRVLQPAQPLEMTRGLQAAPPALSRPSSSSVVRMRGLCSTMRQSNNNKELVQAMRDCPYVAQRSVLAMR